MTFDTSRFTFNAWNNYNGVVMEQGRVQLDSDWNEWLAELQRRLQAGALDVFGYGNPPHCAVYPATTPFAFQITVTTDSSGVNHVNIGPGRMYVDGLVAENHGTPASATWNLTWDPALAELSNTPQPPPASLPSGAAIDYLQQPYYPVTTLPSGNGPFAAYLDVWNRAVTYLEDPNLIDPAVNVDTTGRLQTIWQVKLASVSSGTTCSGAASSPPWSGPSIGQLSNGYFPSNSSGPCCLTSGSGYTGLENQLYRAEIHQPGLSATSTAAAQSGQAMATFKWSRDNGSVQTGVTAIQAVTNSLGNNAAQLSVMSLGRDQTLGFAPGNWIELIDDHLEFLGQPGELHLIDTVDFASKTITLVDTLQNASNFPVDPSNGNATTPLRHTRIVRWDQSGQVYLATPTAANPNATTAWYDLGANAAAGDIPVPPQGSTLILESGITITFGPSNSTQFNTGDYWSFAARASNGQIDPLVDAPPFGIHHHYAMLAIVSFSPISYPDCRVEWPPASVEGACGCCNTYTVGANGDYTSIQTAINALPTSGGEIQILPGRYYENVFIEGLQDVVIRGCGDQTRVASTVLAPGAAIPQAPGTSSTTFNAVFSITTSQNIKLLNFAVEAAPNEVGILVDGTGLLVAPEAQSSAPAAPSNLQTQTKARVNAAPNRGPNATLKTGISTIVIGGVEFEPGDVEIAIENIVLTASTLPAILAARVTELEICDCRIAMANVYSAFGAAWLSGAQIDFIRNWVGIQSNASLWEQFPTVVRKDLALDAGDGGIPLLTSGVALHPGGVQIAGSAAQIRIAENTIQDGCRNGITLGSFTILDANKQDTGIVAGLTFAPPDAGSTANPLTAPTTYPGLSGSTVVAGDPLRGITIDRNTIANMGLCGIGPVGFFDMATVLEIIAVEDLAITGNTISDTLVAATSPEPAANTKGYAAISLPTVENLIVRDNALTNFGAKAGLKVSGIFLLHAEMAEVSRNVVVDRRDWSDPNITEDDGDPKDRVAAIQVEVITPPTLDNVATIASLLLYEPGLPALRMEGNQVRVPRGMALSTTGFGPFAISDNHFSCGGNQTNAWQFGSGEQCVYILNLGVGIDLLIPLLKFSSLYASANDTNVTATQLLPSILSTSGAVTFTNNRCQLELAKAHQVSIASVIIFTLDHLTFSNNHCWVDTGLFGSFVLSDILLLADTLQAIGNRLQEGLLSVYLSGLTIGNLNLTSQNISTYCLDALGKHVQTANNMMLFTPPDERFCMRLIGK